VVHISLQENTITLLKLTNKINDGVWGNLVYISTMFSDVFMYTRPNFWKSSSKQAYLLSPVLYTGNHSAAEKHILLQIGYPTIPHWDDPS
jgi:hypothetical protein